eukprot:gene26124-31544_t
MGNENSSQGIEKVEDGEDQVKETPMFTNQAVQPSNLSPLRNEDFDPSQCIVRPLPREICEWHGRGHSQFAIVIDNVLSQEECRRWIEETEKAGYGQAMVNVGGGREVLQKDYRNSARCLMDDEARASDLWQRVKHFIPDNLRNLVGFKAVELNERLRFLRYDVGEFFAPHCDGAYAHPYGHPKWGSASKITLQLYLNEGFVGGSTRFFTSYRTETCQCYDVVPKAGSVLLFEHSMMHSGEVVAEGRKYAMRTDVQFVQDKGDNNNKGGDEEIDLR